VKTTFVRPMKSACVIADFASRPVNERIVGE
jgi:hypothetical protein